MISPPDANYARVLWDNDVDGTFNLVSLCLKGMTGQKIGFMRHKFVGWWEEEMTRNKNAISDDIAKTAEDQQRKHPQCPSMYCNLYCPISKLRNNSRNLPGREMDLIFRFCCCLIPKSGGRTLADWN